MTVIDVHTHMFTAKWLELLKIKTPVLDPYGEQVLEVVPE